MNIRVTVAVVFAALGLAALAILEGALWLASRAPTEAAESAATEAVLVGGLGGLVLAALIGAAWLFFHLRLVRPLAGLARGAEILVRLDSEGAIELPEAHALGSLVASVRALSERLRAARGEMGKTVAQATARVEETKSRLEAILLDLSEGVVECNLDHRVLLYNQTAARILGAPETLGLGRPLFEVITRAPVLHALERLSYRAAENRARPEELIEPFVCAREGSSTLLQGRMSLIRDPGGQTSGYVLTFADVSDEIQALARRDSLLRAATEGLRAPLANLCAAAETLAAHPELEADSRADFERVINAESAVLSERLEALAAGFRALRGGHWPTADVYSVDLINCVIRHLRETELAVTMIGMPLWLHGDSLSLMLGLAQIIERIHGETGVREFDIEARLGDHRVYLDVIWRGAPIAAKTLDSWLPSPIEGALGAQTLGDVLARHEGELWSQPERADRALVRIPLPAPLRSQFEPAREALPPRPEFYDFDLAHQPAVTGAAGERLLRDSTYVAFDTETTGLWPSDGDEIVSIAGVRIVNGRILTGETFYRMINPERSIPARSTRFHGITDDMVKDKPPARVVLPQFKTFAGDAVLVAHNAAFDMKFLALKEGESGVSFDNAVLDLLLLSAFLHDHTPDHSFDAIAARFGVEVSDRHTALGDAMATAGIFVAMIDLLEDRDIRTLDQALEAANAMIEVRKRQARF
ncbi:MAG: exonuclease domain-containing protein [Alphaproteobacteria bacterium]